MCQVSLLLSYSIVINGCPADHSKRGVRQGDPLFPYLFVLAMEYLTRLLKSLRANNKFKFHPRCQKQEIIQQNFDDDLQLFSRGDVQSTVILYDCFQQFSQVTGLIANSKSGKILCVFWWYQSKINSWYYNIQVSQKASSLLGILESL